MLALQIRPTGSSRKPVSEARPASTIVFQLRVIEIQVSNIHCAQPVHSALLLHHVLELSIAGRHFG